MKIRVVKIKKKKGNFLTDWNDKLKGTHYEGVSSDVSQKC